MNLTDSLRRIAHERPEAVAVLRPRGTPLSFRQLDALVDALARRCAAMGIAPGDVVHVAIRGPFRLIVLQLALARMGAAASAFSLPPAIAAACLIEQPEDARLHPNAHAVDPAWFVPDAARPASPYPSHQDPRAIVALCPSSGTTGPPKAIPVTHAQMAARIAAANAGLPVPREARMICVPSPASGYGYVSQLRTLYAGGTLVMAGTPEDIVAMSRTHGVNRIVTVPFWILRIVEALPAGENLTTIEQIEVAGSFLPRRLHDLARERLGGRLWSVYGVTEAGCVAMAPFDAMNLEGGEVGRVLPGIGFAAFDADGRRLPPGTEGMLRVGGPVCSDRYVGDDAASVESFIDGWLATPDLGRVGPDGMVTLAGRLTDLIVVGGNRLRPSLIEDALLSVPSIDDAAAFGAAGEDGTTRLCAAVVARAPLDRRALDAALRERLPDALPSLVIQVPQVPRNAGGKILRDQLVAMARAAGLAAPR